MRYVELSRNPSLDAAVVGRGVRNRLGRFGAILRHGHGKLRDNYLVFTVDIDRGRVDEKILAHEHIEVFTASSTDESVRRRISELRMTHPGPVFSILDSDHSEAHVLAELELLQTVLVTGDYVVVEDTNLNGHPVLPNYGPGPYEAVQRFLSAHPGQFWHDRAREAKFGFSFAPNGFLVKLQ